MPKRYKYATVFERLLAAHQQQAARRYMRHTLTLEEYTALVTQPCHYCGDPPRYEIRFKDVVHQYQGIDRVDSTWGYIAGNVVPCCWGCNLRKGVKSVEQFTDELRSGRFVYDD